MPGKRDAAYWRDRLEREHPEHFRRLLAGGYPSVRAAAIEAGLIRERTPMMDLQRAWRRADAADRAAFLDLAGAAPPAPPPASGTATPIPALVRAIAEELAAAGGDPDEVADITRNYAAPVQRHVHRFLLDMEVWQKELAGGLDAPRQARLRALLDALAELIRDD